MRHLGGVPDLPPHVPADCDSNKPYRLVFGLAFGSCTVHLASRTEAIVEILFSYPLIKAFLWAGRVVLEAAYPVRLRLFSVEPFTAVVMPGLLFEMPLFAASTVLARKAMVAGVAPGNALTG